MTDRNQRYAVGMVETMRLSVVVALVAVGYAVAPLVSDTGADIEQHRLITSLLGALVGYVIGGVTGRALLGAADRTARRATQVDAGALIAGALSAAAAAFFAFAVLWPVLLLPSRSITIPTALIVVLALVWTGGRIGVARADDLRRFVGVRGRLDVSSPAKGAGTKILDTSALADGRLVAIADRGFLEGTLVIPEAVLRELQGLSDDSDEQRRRAGRRGLDEVKDLQEQGHLAIEIDDSPRDPQTSVDEHLIAVATSRNAALVTVDGGLARLAEVKGLRVLNMYELAETMRPPVLPGDTVSIMISKPGSGRAQGVGYLEDGTMVVVEKAKSLLGETVDVAVTSVTQSRNGRMLFAELPSA